MTSKRKPSGVVPCPRRSWRRARERRAGSTTGGALSCGSRAAVLLGGRGVGDGGVARAWVRLAQATRQPSHPSANRPRQLAFCRRSPAREGTFPNRALSSRLACGRRNISPVRGLYPIVDVDSLRGARPVHRRACSCLASRAVVAFAERVLLARPPLLQLRAKHGSTRDTLELLRALRPLCSKFGTRLIANDRPDLAVLAGCDGVHIGQDDLPLPLVRLLAPGLLVGVSTHTLEQLAASPRRKAGLRGLRTGVRHGLQRARRSVGGLGLARPSARSWRGARASRWSPSAASISSARRKSPSTADLAAVIAALAAESRLARRRDRGGASPARGAQRAALKLEALDLPQAVDHRFERQRRRNVALDVLHGRQHDAMLLGRALGLLDAQPLLARAPRWPKIARNKPASRANCRARDALRRT